MLDFLTQPKFPQTALGIEKGRLTALSLSREGRGTFGVRNGAVIEMPPGLITPSFTDRNIHSPQRFRASVEEVMTAAGLLGQRSWSVSLPSSSARSAIVTLDETALQKGDSEEILDWKAEQTFGLPAERLRITREKITSESGKARYFATAVQLSVIEEYELVFEAMGIKAGLVLPRAICESNWLISTASYADSLLISSNDEGFTAVVLRGSEPNVVRSVTCSPAEQDDEIYRLLMFYQDRFVQNSAEMPLERVLAIGEIAPEKLRQISREALGREVTVMDPRDVGFMTPGGLSFADLAAPAGLAAFGM
ncbi:MAG: hypothetical protein KF685_11015 [Acidobacteria bacterium]|nr:hypothetical protein [Acidobacteriota bacterium]